MKKSPLFLLAGLFTLFLCTCEKPAELLLNELQVLDQSTVDIYSSTCYREGEALTVINPESLEFDFYASDLYRIEWKTANGTIGKGYFMDCSCDQSYAIRVTNVLTKKFTEVKYKTIPCVKVEVN